MRGDLSKQKWLAGLGVEDLAFAKRFLLASGSLKRVAQEYGISYPTVRLRLDRLIDKIRLYDEQSVSSEFERKMRLLVADGQINVELMNTILDAHALQIEEDTQ